MCSFCLLYFVIFLIIYYTILSIYLPYCFLHNNDKYSHVECYDGIFLNIVHASMFFYFYNIMYLLNIIYLILNSCNIYILWVNIIRRTLKYNNKRSCNILFFYFFPDKNLLNGNLSGMGLDPIFGSEGSILDVLEIPGKGRCHVYIAR